RRSTTTSRCSSCAASSNSNNSKHLPAKVSKCAKIRYKIIFFSRVSHLSRANYLTMLKLENYIGGELIAPASNEYLDNYNPATGEVYSLIPDSDERDVERAVEAAKKAFPVWSKMSAEARHDCLMRVSALI